MTRPTSPGGPKRRRIALLLAGLTLAGLLVAPSARASRLETARERLARLEREIRQQQAAIQAQHGRIEAIAARLSHVQAARATTASQLLATQRRLTEAQTRYDALRSRLGQIVRTAYEVGPLAPIEALLGSTSFTSLVQRIAYLESVQTANETLANDVANRSARLRTTRRTLRSLSAQQARRANALLSLQAALLSGLLDQQRQLEGLSAARRKAARLVRLLSVSVDPGLIGAGTTFGHWAHLLLARLGAPTCRDNLTVIVAWEVAEGTAAAYNPLATTHDYPGATEFNAVGVKNYPSLEAGLQATIETLRLGAATHGYGAILAGLEGCASAEVTAAAINASDWCRDCAGGMYVLDVLPLVEADYSRFARG